MADSAYTRRTVFAGLATLRFSQKKSAREDGSRAEN
jgi:hypothetical protein